MSEDEDQIGVGGEDAEKDELGGKGVHSWGGTTAALTIAFGVLVTWVLLAMYVRGTLCWQAHCARCYRRVNKDKARRGDPSMGEDPEEWYHDDSDWQYDHPCTPVWWERYIFLVKRKYSPPAKT